LLTDLNEGGEVDDATYSDEDNEDNEEDEEDEDAGGLTDLNDSGEISNLKDDALCSQHVLKRHGTKSYTPRKNLKNDGWEEDVGI
jgi:hypothetical protein